MLSPYILFVLLIQGTLVFCEEVQAVNETSTRDVLKEKPETAADEVIPAAKMDWMDLFTGPNVFPTSSIALMSQAANSDKSLEEQCKAIKETAKTISSMCQNEIVNLMDYVLQLSGKNTENNSTKERSKRSAESPMDSSKLVMRLLKHIKSNNEYQNIAIDKMMSAEEIAKKYGINYNPDPEILLDLADAANEHAQEMASILDEIRDTKNASKEELTFVPLEKENKTEKPKENDIYYVYAVSHPESFEYAPQEIKRPVKSQSEKKPASSHQHKHQYETQIPAPVPQYRHQCHHQPNVYQPSPYYSAPVTPKPSFYETVVYPEYYTPYCSMEPISSTTTTIVLPVEELVEPEPQLIGEEYEEAVSSKIKVDHEKPGEATVNHVMTYTLTEKSHYKKPEIEKLPEQVQYSFFLI